MAANKVIESMVKLIEVKSHLLNLSREKTDMITIGSIDKLQALLVRERQSIQVLEQAEATRKTVTNEWLIAHQLAHEHGTITEMLTLMKDDQAKQDLEQVATQLTDIIIQLRQQEQLNQELIKQSMQFIQISLDVMNPSIKQMNYGNNKDTRAVEYSVFDSKA